MTRANGSTTAPRAGTFAAAALRRAAGRLLPWLIPLLVAIGLAVATAPGSRGAAPDHAGGFERQSDLTAVLRPTAVARFAVRSPAVKPGAGYDPGDDRDVPLAPALSAPGAGHAGPVPLPRLTALAGFDARRLRPEPRAPPA